MIIKWYKYHKIVYFIWEDFDYIINPLSAVVSSRNKRFNVRRKFLNPTYIKCYTLKEKEFVYSLDFISMTNRRNGGEFFITREKLQNWYKLNINNSWDMEDEDIIQEIIKRGDQSIL